MQTLVETQFFTPSLVPLNEELSSKEVNMFVKGILSTVEVKNGNGRFYSRELWEREIKDFQKKIDAKSTGTCGELDHADNQVINLKNASHAIRKIWWEGDNIMGLVEIFSSAGEKGNIAGRTLASFFHNGLVVGISSRGAGSLEEIDGVQEVQDDFSLICWDFVSTPSNPNSWFNPVKSNLNESLVKKFDVKYDNVNRILNEILCSNGTCPIF